MRLDHVDLRHGRPRRRPAAERASSASRCCPAASRRPGHAQPDRPARRRLPGADGDPRPRGGRRAPVRAGAARGWRSRARGWAVLVDDVEAVAERHGTALYTVRRETLGALVPASRRRCGSRRCRSSSAPTTAGRDRATAGRGRTDLDRGRRRRERACASGSAAPSCRCASSRASPRCGRSGSASASSAPLSGERSSWRSPVSRPPRSGPPAARAGAVTARSRPSPRASPCGPRRAPGQRCARARSVPADPALPSATPRARASFTISCRSAALTPPSAHAICTSGTSGSRHDRVGREPELVELLDQLRIGQPSLGSQFSARGVGLGGAPHLGDQLLIFLPEVLFLA